MASLPLANQPLESLAGNTGWKVGKLARELGVSARTLRRHIIAKRGIGARAWLDTLRLRQGAALLAVDHLPIKVVAFELGFKQPSHFSTKFKLEFGVSPRQFQRTRPRADEMRSVNRAALEAGSGKRVRSAGGLGDVPFDNSIRLPGDYFLRLRVDGVDSEIITYQGNPPVASFNPRFQIPVP